MDPVVLAATIAAVPALVAAFAAWKNHEKVKTSNGKTLGMLVESIYHDLSEHINNSEIHQAECHAHVQNQCPFCANLLS